MNNKINLVEKPKDLKNTTKRLFSYFKPYKVKIIVIFILAVLSASLAIVGPKILARATNTIVDGYIKIKIYDSVINNLPEGVVLPKNITGKDIINMLPKEAKSKLTDNQLDMLKDMAFDKKPTIDFKAILKIVIIYAVIYLFSISFNYIQSFIVTNVSQKVTYNLRSKVFKKIDKIPLKYYDKTNNGDILSRITNDVDTLSNTITQNLSQSVIIFTTIIGILVMMITINLSMTLIAVLILPLSLIFIKKIMGFSQKYFKKQQEELGKINSHIEEMYAGSNIVKAFNNEEESISKFDNYNQELYNTALNSQLFSGLMMPIIQFLGNIGYVLVCILGGYLVVKNKMNIGDIQAFVQYLRQFLQSTAQSANIISSFQSTIAATERIFEFLDVEEEKEDSLKIIGKMVDSDILFKDVQFGYSPDKMVIKGFDLDIKKGSKIAIVGPTGAGKTTLVKLLMRFYDINKGEILIDGINIQNYSKKALRQSCGMVLQDTWLFNGSILDNIKYSKEDATYEEVREASKKAMVDHFVNTLPDGYNYVLNEETNNISLGEKQLLTIARAILANPKILILDEATSSVDTRTELLINEAMKNLMKDRTSFIIAHRLSTIKNASTIVVMNDGDIVEIGSHNELLKKKGFYYNLYNSQFDVGE